MIPEKLGKFEMEKQFHDEILKIAEITKQSQDEFNELSVILNSQHIINDIFHNREMQ